MSEENGLDEAEEEEGSSGSDEEYLSVSGSIPRTSEIDVENDNRSNDNISKLTSAKNSSGNTDKIMTENTGENMPGDNRDDDIAQINTMELLGAMDSLIPAVSLEKLSAEQVDKHTKTQTVNKNTNDETASGDSYTDMETILLDSDSVATDSTPAEGNTNVPPAVKNQHGQAIDSSTTAPNLFYLYYIYIYILYLLKNLCFRNEKEAINEETGCKDNGNKQQLEFISPPQLASTLICDDMQDDTSSEGEVTKDGPGNLAENPTPSNAARELQESVASEVLETTVVKSAIQEQDSSAYRKENPQNAPACPNRNGNCVSTNSNKTPNDSKIEIVDNSDDNTTDEDTQIDTNEHLLRNRQKKSEETVESSSEEEVEVPECHPPRKSLSAPEDNGENMTLAGKLSTARKRGFLILQFCWLIYFAKSVVTLLICRYTH
uniref:COS41.6 n=1 Tax=Ciona intestinalis TaxID=7719 RepID=P91584_CIOIN|nr:COS41.6 [Ciona intestinalis]